jgi:hypothetical protein
MSEIICSKCDIVLQFGFDYHWHCNHPGCLFICDEYHDHPANGGWCGKYKCGTYHEHCSKEGCDKLLDEENYDLCSLCEKAKVD